MHIYRRLTHNFIFTAARRTRPGRVAGMFHRSREADRTATDVVGPQARTAAGRASASFAAGKPCIPEDNMAVWWRKVMSVTSVSREFGTGFTRTFRHIANLTDRMAQWIGWLPRTKPNIRPAGPNCPLRRPCPPAIARPFVPSLKTRLQDGVCPARQRLDPAVIPTASTSDSCLLPVMPGLVPGISLHRFRPAKRPHGCPE